MKARQLSILTAIMIVVYGTLGQLLLPYFQWLIENYLLNTSEIWLMLKDFLVGRKETESDVYNLGRYLIYTPLYIGLHIILINSLFWGQKRNRMIANLVFFGILVSLVFSVLLSYTLQIIPLYEFSIGLFNKFTKLPLILFLVEGGRVLIKDIDQKLRKKENAVC